MIKEDAKRIALSVVKSMLLILSPVIVSILFMELYTNFEIVRFMTVLFVCLFLSTLTLIAIRFVEGLVKDLVKLYKRKMKDIN